jgi:membrane protease YdiL (CAAX protease family)
MRNRVVVVVLDEMGLTHLPPFYRDPRFIVTLPAVCLVLVIMQQWVLPDSPAPWQASWSLLAAFTLWQPLIEELLFRGLVQGQLLRLPWGGRAWYGVTSANVVTSLLFTGLHFIHHPPLWAASVVVPSLLFGYFRDRHHSLYPALVLHILFNSGYALARMA